MNHMRPVLSLSLVAVLTCFTISLETNALQPRKTRAYKVIKHEARIWQSGIRSLIKKIRRKPLTRSELHDYRRFKQQGSIVIITALAAVGIVLPRWWWPERKQGAGSVGGPAPKSGPTTGEIQPVGAQGGKPLAASGSGAAGAGVGGGAQSDADDQGAVSPRAISPEPTSGDPTHLPLTPQPSTPTTRSLEQEASQAIEAAAREKRQLLQASVKDKTQILKFARTCFGWAQSLQETFPGDAVPWLKLAGDILTATQFNPAFDSYTEAETLKNNIKLLTRALSRPSQPASPTRTAQPHSRVQKFFKDLAGFETPERPAAQPRRQQTTI